MKVLFDVLNEILGHLTRVGSKALPQETENTSNVDTV